MTFPLRLDRSLDLEERVSTPDGAGGFDVTWQRLGTHWAQVVPRSGKERSVGGRVVPSNAYRIFLRAAPVGAPSRPRPEQRFRDGTRVYSILAVAECNNHNQYLECWAEEGKGE